MTALSGTRWWPGALLVAFAAAAAAFGLLFVRVYRIERAAFAPPPRGSLIVPTAQAGIPGLRDVTIPASATRTLGAWYVPPQHGVLVIVTHGTGADRSRMLPEVRALQAAGFGVLAFDWPGHGVSDGESHWGQPEREALAAVTTWALAQPGVDADRLGVLGFSYGGYIVAQHAASDTRLRRVALVSTPSDVTEQAYAEYADWTPLAGWCAVQSLGLLGVERDGPAAVDVVARIAPRPLLIVTGGDDTAVPTEMADTLLAHAREPKSLVRIPGAGHGDFMQVDSTAYIGALRRFFAPPPSAPATPTEAHGAGDGAR